MVLYSNSNHSNGGLIDIHHSPSPVLAEKEKINFLVAVHT